MTKYSLWDFQVEINEGATKKWYAQSEIWGCTCKDCRNFLKIAREKNLPSPILKMLFSLDIPPEKATYVCNNFTDKQGLHYQFSYRMAGHILGDSRSSSKQDWGEIRCCHEPYPYGAPAFPEPHFDLEFYVTLPWVLETY